MRRIKKGLVLAMCMMLMLCFSMTKTEAKEPQEAGQVLQFTRGEYRMAIADGVNIRTEAGTQYASLGKLYYGDIVKVLDSKEVYSSGYYWLYIQRLSDGIKGWVVASYLA